MKKISALLLTLLFTLLLPFSHTAHAADNGTLYAADMDNENLSNGEEATDHAFLDERGYISLKPFDDTIGKLAFKITARVGGEYNITIHYTAKAGSAERKLGFAIGTNEIENILLETGADWDSILTFSKTVTLSAGDNIIYITTPTDYDNTTVKTPNIYCLEYELTKAEEGSDVLHTYYAVDAAYENLKSTSEYVNLGLFDYFGYIDLTPSAGIGSITFTIPSNITVQKQFTLYYGAPDPLAACTADFSVNGSEKQTLYLTTDSNPETILTHTFTVDLLPGENKITLSSTVDFDNCDVRTPNVYALSYILTAEEEEAPLETLPTKAPDIIEHGTGSDTDSNTETDYYISDTASGSEDTKNSFVSPVGIVIIIVIALAIVAGITILLTKKFKNRT